VIDLKYSSTHPRHQLYGPLLLDQYPFVFIVGLLLLALNSLHGVSRPAQLLRMLHNLIINEEFRIFLAHPIDNLVIIVEEFEEVVFLAF
jgi:hypothetical protein